MGGTLIIDLNEDAGVALDGVKEAGGLSFVLYLLGQGFVPRINAVVVWI